MGRVVAACDPQRKAAEAAGAERVYTDWRELIADADCDVIVVATPPAEHAEAAIAALRAGRAVLLEKPVAAAVADGERIAAAAAETGRVVAVGFNQRCHPALVRLRERMARGELGRVGEIRVRWSSGAGLGARTWLGERAQGGGAILDLGSHVVDLWRFLTGRELAGLRAESRSELLDDEQARLYGELGDGVKGVAELSLVGADLFEIVVTGSGGRARVAPYGAGFRASYAEQWRRLAAAVRGAGTVAAGLEDGLISLRWVTGAASGLAVRRNEEWAAEEFAMTVVSSTTVGYAAIRTTVAHLRRQTVAGRLELVMVGPTVEALAGPEEELAGFGAVVRVGVGPVQSIAHANAAGVRRARGRVVALTEDHCFPEPEWAEALLRAHEEDWAVVGPVMVNGNPGSMVSEADFVIGYGPWMAPMGPEEMSFLPGHNSCYRRDALMALGGRLERLLEAETVLHMEWVAQGRRMRAATWPRRRQLFFAAASPLIPLVRLWRVAGEFRRPGRSYWRLARMAPALVIGLALDGVGQFLGYAVGPGDAMARLARYEFNRVEHVREADRGVWDMR